MPGRFMGAGVAGEQGAGFGLVGDEQVDLMPWDASDDIRVGGQRGGIHDDAHPVLAGGCDDVGDLVGELEGHEYRIGRPCPSR